MAADHRGSLSPPPQGLHHNPTHTDLAHPDLAPHRELVIWVLPPPPHPDNGHRTPAAGPRPDPPHPDRAANLAGPPRHHQHPASHPDPPRGHHQRPRPATRAGPRRRLGTNPHHPKRTPPGRITVIDTDDTPATAHTLLNVLATRTQPPGTEPQLALRHGTTHIPRLTPIHHPDTTTHPGRARSRGHRVDHRRDRSWAAVFAEHLITNHGVRHLVLVSRRGLTAPGGRRPPGSAERVGRPRHHHRLRTANPDQLAAVLDHGSPPRTG